MKLKVYGWQGFRRECPGAHSQTREIVAARSQTEAARLAGTTVARMFNLSETGNPREVEIAMATPGVIFWTPISGQRKEYTAAAQLPER